LKGTLSHIPQPKPVGTASALALNQSMSERL